MKNTFVQLFSGIFIIVMGLFLSSCEEEAEAPPAVPLKPTIYRVIVVSSSEIEVKWRDNSDNEDGFRIERTRLDTGIYFQTVGFKGANDTVFHDSGLLPLTNYGYRVIAYNATGNSGSSSVLVGLTLRSPNPPNPPITLRAVPISDTKVYLAWQDNSSNEVGFRIERAAPGTSNFFGLDTVAENISGYEDGSLTPQTTYQYRVHAYNEYGISSFSNTVSVIPGTNVIAPNPPTNLVANTVSATQVSLSWNDNSPTETGYRLERAFTGSSIYTLIASLEKGTTTYRDKNLNPATNYTYRVQAYNNVGLSAFSNPADAVTDALSGLPNPPSGLQAATKSSTQIWLDWTDNSSNEDGFYIERAPASTTDYEIIQTVLANVISYHVTGLRSSTSYSFRVRAFNQDGLSTYSNIITRTTPALQGSPPQPSLMQLVELGATRIKIKWKDNSQNEDGFYVERAPAGTLDFVQIATTGINEIEYEDNEVQPSTGYSYHAQAFNLLGVSNKTNTITVTTTGQTETQFINGSSHSIVSLIIDGEQYFTPPQIIPTGSYLPVVLSAGRHYYSMKNGKWEGLLAQVLYSDTGQFYQQPDGSGFISFSDPTIFEIMTKSRFSANWEAKYNGGADSMAFRFLSDGTFYFYNELGQRSSGLYSLKQHTGTTIVFSTGFADGTYIEEPGTNYFTMPNGPPSEAVLRYYFQENQ